MMREDRITRHVSQWRKARRARRNQNVEILHQGIKCNPRMTHRIIRICKIFQVKIISVFNAVVEVIVQCRAMSPGKIAKCRLPFPMQNDAVVPV